VPMVCLETALPVKFAETIREAIGIEPQRPAAFQGIEDLPQRATRMAVDTDGLKRFIASHCD
jgi:threonine synthase